MMEEWGEYIVSSGKRVRSSKPQITINKNGIISFNSAFCKYYVDLKKIKGIELYYFEKVNYLCFKIINETITENAIKTNIVNKISFNISANSFFIEIRKKSQELIGKYSPQEKEINQLGKIYYIQLNKE